MATNVFISHHQQGIFSMNHLRTLIGNFTRLTPTLLNSPQPFQHGHKQLIIDLHCHNQKLYSNIVITKFNKFIIHDNSYYTITY